MNTFTLYEPETDDAHFVASTMHALETELDDLCIAYSDPHRRRLVEAEWGRIADLTRRLSNILFDMKKEAA